MRDKNTECKHELISQDYLGQPNGRCIICGAVVIKDEGAIIDENNKTNNN